MKKELGFFLQAKVPQVKFLDRTFNCNPRRTVDLWQWILDHDNGITNFHFEIAADLITEEELAIMEQMRPGLIQLEIGVQSTNMETVHEIDRVMDLDLVRNVTAKVKSFGNIHQHLDLIAGLPGEDLDSFHKSFDDVFAMEPEQLQLGFLKVLREPRSIVWHSNMVLSAMTRRPMRCCQRPGFHIKICCFSKGWKRW